MKRRQLITGIGLAFFLLLAHTLPAQETDGAFSGDREPVFSVSPDFSMMVGGSFTTAGSAGHFFRHSIAPQISWDTGRSFQLKVGTVFSTTRMHAMHQHHFLVPQMEGSGQMHAGPAAALFSTTVYAVGAYQVNPRLNLIGATWMERTANEADFTPVNPYAFNHNPRGMMLGFDYRVSENLRFGAEVNFSSGFNPYSPLHFNQSPFGTFHSPMPFHQTGRW